MTEANEISKKPPEANSVTKKQNERPIELSSERLGADDTKPAVLPIGSGGQAPKTS